MSDSRPLRILHLFPHEMGINGDVGNVTALIARARWAGHEVEVVNFEPGDALADEVDLVHLGSGPLSAQRSVYPELIRIAPVLREWAGVGVPFLAVSGGWQLLGRELVLPDGERMVGAGVLPSVAVLSQQQGERRVGELLVASSFGTLAGFENHSSAVQLADGAEPLGTITASEFATAGRTRLEGVRLASLIGTNLHGPVLPMNPVLADFLLAAALRRAGLGADASVSENKQRKRVDGYAAQARAAIAERLRRG